MLITIRPVEPADVIPMAAIRAREWETQAFWTGRIRSYLSGEHSPQQALPVRAAFVAFDAAELMGFVAGHLTRRFGCDGELQWINVFKEKRGQRIADRLMAKMGAWFAEQDAYRVCVNVEPKNTAARKLYCRCGALRLNEHWMIWRDSRLMGTPMEAPANRHQVRGRRT
jgi:GNAT superfamily N-acetyltransferase